jgi:hypothetical protein
MFNIETFRLYEYLQAIANMQTYVFVRFARFEPLTYIVNSDLEVKINL